MHVATEATKSRYAAWKVKESCTDIACAVNTAKPSVIAKYAFQAEAPTELSLAKGDIIQVLQNIDDNWARGRCNDKEGIFPLK